MTVLSVNLNKLALLRNSRGRNFPDLLDFTRRFIAMGVKGITVHPRPDERHIRYQDARELAALLKDFPELEFNIEGYPNDSFLALIEETRPHQCTLVPDADNQLTSDHGWDCIKHKDQLIPIIDRIKKLGVRAAVFLDPVENQTLAAAAIGADRIELYTEEYANAFGSENCDAVFGKYLKAAQLAGSHGLGVNAGHDLDLQNLPLFLTIPGILEVSIGHALTIESIEQGMAKVVAQYLSICSVSASS